VGRTAAAEILIDQVPADPTQRQIDPEETVVNRLYARQLLAQLATRFSKR